MKNQDGSREGVEETLNPILVPATKVKRGHVPLPLGPVVAVVVAAPAAVARETEQGRREDLPNMGGLVSLRKELNTGKENENLALIPQTVVPVPVQTLSLPNRIPVLLLYARKERKSIQKPKRNKRKKTSVKHTAKSSMHKKEKRRKHKAKDASKTKKKKDKPKSQKKQKEVDGTEPRLELPSTLTDTLPEKETSNQIKGIKAAIAANTGKRRGPMTREEYEKQQSVVRRVFDPDTGRHRLVKGDGEIIEEIVSREQQKAINKQATLGDGASFQAGIAKLL